MDLLYDCLIRNARILDGSGAPAFSGDVALSGGSIAAVGELSQASASHIIDAAVSPTVARTKCPNSNVAGHANTFIFPDINAGNIGYKICQRMGSFDAYGPILQGLNAPINDLSRGCNAQEVYSMAIITAGLCND